MGDFLGEHDVIADGALDGHPGGVAVVCPTCRQSLGNAIAVVADGRLAFDVTAEVLAAHESHMSTEHPTEGEV